MNERYLQGWDKLAEVDGETGDKVIQALKDIAPDVGQYIIEFAFGDIYTRSGLTLQEREMITISSLLTAGGCENQLKVHIQGAINVGLSAQQIIEVFIQAIPYTGFPKVLNAIFVAKSVFNDNNISAV